MDISNRTLGLLLIAAIVVSIGSTFFMLNSITMAPGFSGTTGYLTSDSGNVSLNISEYISIAVKDSSINFGKCNLNTTYTTNTSFESSDFNNTGNNTLCQDSDLTSTHGDWLAVENDGTIDVILNVTSNETANDVYVDSNNQSTTHSQYYVELNNSETGSCTSNNASSYKVLGTTPVQICGVLHWDDTADLVNVFAKVDVDNTAKAQDKKAKWTFTAWNN